MRFRKETFLLSCTFVLSLAICFGILHVQGTILEIAITTKGVNSPHIRNTRANIGTRLMSCQFRCKSWKSERVNAPEDMAVEREEL